MQISSKFHVSVFLMAVLTFSTPIVTLTQENPIIAVAKSHAVTDAKNDFNKVSWFGTEGFLNTFGVMMVQTNEPPVPAGRLVGKSPEYLAVYTLNYQAKSTQNQRTSDVEMLITVGLVCTIICCVVVLWDTANDLSSGGSGSSSGSFSGWCGGLF